MLKTIISLATLILSSCSTYPQCVDILYMHTNEKECIDKGYWYQGKMIASLNPNLYAGLVISTKYLGEAKGFDKSLLCKEKPNLKWKFYQVAIPGVDGGTWYLDGEGWGDSILVHPNKMYMKSREGGCYK